MGFIRVALSSLVIQFLGILFAFFVALSLARVLGPEAYGEYTFCLSVAMVIAIPVQNALPILVLRTVAQLGSGYIVEIIFVAARIIAIYAAPIFLLLLCWYLLSEEKELSILYLLCAVLAFVQTCTIVLSASLRGGGKVIWGQLPEIIIRPLFFFVLIILIFVANDFYKTSLAALLFVHISAALVALSFVCILLKHYSCINKQQRDHDNRLYVKRYAVALMPLIFVAGLQVINQQLDILLLGGSSDFIEVGVYKVAVQLSSLVGFGLIAINQVLHHRFAHLYKTGCLHELQRVVTMGARIITLIALCVALLFWVFGDLIIYLFFGAEYGSAYVPLAILVAGQMANAVFGSVGALLNMTGHEKDTMLGMFLACALNLVLGLILIPEFGMVGAACSSAISLFTWNAVLWLFVKKRLNIESTVFFKIKY